MGTSRVKWLFDIISHWVIVYHKIGLMGNSTNSWLFQFTRKANITQIVLKPSSWWNAIKAVLGYYVWYTSFSMCLYGQWIIQIFVWFVLNLCLKSLHWLLFFNQFVWFIPYEREFSSLRSTIEWQTPHGFLKGSVLNIVQRQANDSITLFVQNVQNFICYILTLS